MAADGTIKIGVNLDKTELNKNMSGIEGDMSKWAGKISGILAAIGIGKMVKDFATAGIQFNAQMESFSAGFETLLGSASRAEDMLSDLQRFAKDTPFEIEGLSKAATQLLSFGTKANDIMPTLKMLGDISQGNQENFEGLALVFSQVKSQGKLLSNDLYQMINRGFNPLQIISEKTGQSMGELREEMADGAITFDMVADAMKTATSEGGMFFNAMETQSKTAMGQWATLQDNFKATAGTIMMPISQAITSVALPALNKFFDSFDAQPIANFVGEASSDLMTLAGVVGNAVLPPIATLFNFIVTNGGAIVPILTQIGVGFAAFNAVEPATKAMQFFKETTSGLSAVLSTVDAAVKSVAIGGSGLTQVLQGTTTAGTIFNGVVQTGATFTKSLQAGMGLATAATSAMTVAQGALNAAFIANPIGLVVAAIAALTVGLGFAVAESMKLSDETIELTAANEKHLETLNKSKDAYGNTVEKMQEQGVVAKGLLTKIEELNRVEGKSAEQKQEMQSYVKALNDTMGQTVIEYNAQTDALNKNITTIKLRVEHMLEEAKVEAVKERLIEITKEQILNDEKLEATQGKLAEKQALLSDGFKLWTDSLFKGGPAVAQVYKEVKTLEEDEASLIDKQEELSGSFDYLTGVASDFTTEMTNSGQKVRQGAQQTFGQTSQDMTRYGTEGMTNYSRGVQQGAGQVNNAMRSVTQNAANSARSQAQQSGQQTGQAVTQGMSSGIQSGASGVLSSMLSMARNAINAAKSALGIRSPSKIFMGIGEFVSLGLAEGIDAEAGSVEKSLQAISRDMANTDFSAAITQAKTLPNYGNAAASIQNAPITQTIDRGIVVHVTIEGGVSNDYDVMRLSQQIGAQIAMQERVRGISKSL